MSEAAVETRVEDKVQERVPASHRRQKGPHGRHRYIEPQVQQEAESGNKRFGGLDLSRILSRFGTREDNHAETEEKRVDGARELPSPYWNTEITGVRNSGEPVLTAEESMSRYGLAEPMLCKISKPDGMRWGVFIGEREHEGLQLQELRLLPLPTPGGQINPELGVPLIPGKENYLLHRPEDDKEKAYGQVILDAKGIVHVVENKVKELLHVSATADALVFPDNENKLDRLVIANDPTFMEAVFNTIKEDPAGIYRKEINHMRNSQPELLTYLEATLGGELFGSDSKSKEQFARGALVAYRMLRLLAEKYHVAIPKISPDFLHAYVAGNTNELLLSRHNRGDNNTDITHFDMKEFCANRLSTVDERLERIINIITPFEIDNTDARYGAFEITSILNKAMQVKRDEEKLGIS